ncbi:MAG: hypothetical protein AAGC74_13915 [Verrucomicrobiota bacterium]
MKLLLQLALCSSVAYFAHPFVENMLDKEKEDNAGLQVLILNTVQPDEVIGSWVLSPRSTRILASTSGTSGRRLGLTLESWGGGHASFRVGDYEIDGPIAWHIKPGVGSKPAVLMINSTRDHMHLKFSKVNNGLVLIGEAETPVPGEREFIRFLKAS